MSSVGLQVRIGGRVSMSFNFNIDVPIRILCFLLDKVQTQKDNFLLPCKRSCIGQSMSWWLVAHLLECTTYIVYRPNTKLNQYNFFGKQTTCTCRFKDINNVQALKHWHVAPVVHIPPFSVSSCTAKLQERSPMAFPLEKKQCVSMK
jgi:hypothetical protein